MYFENYSKEVLADIAKNHARKCSELYGSEIESSKSKAEVYSLTYPVVEANPSNVGECKFYLRGMDTISAIRYFSKFGKVCALNFADFKSPGGGFMTGHSAQEEALCFESTLYNVLSSFDDYYSWNKQHMNNGLYEDRAIYTPDIVICDTMDDRVPKYSDGTVKCDIITCAAPNKRNGIRYNKFTTVDNLNSLFKRILFMINVAAKNNVKTLILGAWGCGIFGQDPRDVSFIFRELIANNKLGYLPFERVVFAIPDPVSENFRVFNKTFNGFLSNDI